MGRIKEWVLLYGDEVKGGLKVLWPLFIIVLVKYHGQMLEHWERSQLQGESIAVILDKEGIEHIHESEMGGQVRVKAYLVEYQYTVGMQDYIQKAFLERSRYNTKERIRLKQIQIGDSLLVRYDLLHVEKSKLVVN